MISKTFYSNSKTIPHKIPVVNNIELKSAEFQYKIKDLTQTIQARCPLEVVWTGLHGIVLCFFFFAGFRGLFISLVTFQQDILSGHFCPTRIQAQCYAKEAARYGAACTTNSGFAWGPCSTSPCTGDVCVKESMSPSFCRCIPSGESEVTKKSEWFESERILIFCRILSKKNNDIFWVVFGS
jgi:hypothetical protein